MWCLLHILPLILGRLLSGDEHYHCLLQLHDICAIVFSPLISHDQVPYLRILVKDYLMTFTDLYPERPLTPKFHYLVHLPRIIIRYKCTNHELHCMLLRCCYKFSCNIGLAHLWGCGQWDSRPNIASWSRLQEPPASKTSAGHLPLSTSSLWHTLCSQHLHSALQAFFTLD